MPAGMFGSSTLSGDDHDDDDHDDHNHDNGDDDHWLQCQLGCFRSSTRDDDHDLMTMQRDLGGEGIASIV